MLQVCFFKVVLLCTIGVGGGELSSTSDKLGDSTIILYFQCPRNFTVVQLFRGVASDL